LGFAKGNNIGINFAHGEYIFTINQDIILKDDYLEKVISRFEQIPDDFGSLSGKILRFDGKTIDSAGLIITKSRRFFDRGSGEIDSGQYDREQEVFGVCAASAIYRRKMLEKIQRISGHSFFDERFFLLLEDIDLAWRAIHAGYRSLYYPEAVCFHIRGGSVWKNTYKQYLSFRNRYFLLLKNEFSVNIFLSMFRLLFYDISRLVYMFLSNKYTYRGIKEIVSMSGSILSDRRKILRQSTRKPAEFRKWFKKNKTLL
jgi:GT2 family glycosyltransferase